VSPPRAFSIARALSTNNRPKRIKSRAFCSGAKNEEREPAKVCQLRTLDRGNDWQLVQRAREGDREALDVLFAEFRSRLYRTAFSVLGNHEDAEDAVQDALLWAYAGIWSFEGRSLFSSWLTRIVINAALHQRRKKRRRPMVSIHEMAVDDGQDRIRQIVDSHPDPEILCHSSELRSLVEDRLKRMPKGNRLAFRLCEIEGTSQAEAANVAGIPLATLKSRVSRARKRLAKNLGSALRSRRSGSLWYPKRPSVYFGRSSRQLINGAD
jgi:RNA polymerase sigma-70 factor, ECF subfamily